jgi:hypothetical protein
MRILVVSNDPLAHGAIADLVGQVDDAEVRGRLTQVRRRPSKVRHRLRTW